MLHFTHRFVLGLANALVFCQLIGCFGSGSIANAQFGRLGSRLLGTKPNSTETSDAKSLSKGRQKELLDSPKSIQQVGYEALAPASGASKLSATVPSGTLFEPGRVLAIVAGEPIFEGDLLLTINEVIQTKAADAPDFVKQKMIEQGIRELLPRSIERKMLYHEAISKLPSPDQIESIKKDLFKQLEEKQLPQMFKKYEVKNLGELDARLRMLGSSWRAVKEQAAEQEIAKFGVMSQVTIDTEISHDELYQQYLNQRENYTMDNQVRWEHLLVSFASEPDRANAKRKLGRMGNEVVYGAKFSEVAKKDSSGFFAASGGYNDWTKRGALTNQILEEQIFTTPVGRLSDIFESPQGYHIIRVIEHQEAGYVPFEEVQDTIREGMLDERQSVAANGLMEKIKNKIPYEILVEGVKF